MHRFFLEKCTGQFYQSLQIIQVYVDKYQFVKFVQETDISAYPVLWTYVIIIVLLSVKDVL